MKILLIYSPFFEYRTVDMTPLGVAYLAAALKKAGFDCDVYDSNKGIETINEAIIQAIKYDIVGISSNSLSFLSAVKIAEGIKKARDIPIILGGFHGTFSYKEIMEEYSCFDYIIRGEGESAIVELCRDYEYNSRPTKIIDGIIYKDYNGSFITSDTIRTEDQLDELPFPYRDFHKPYQRIDQYGRPITYVSILSSRGCPYDCKFCSVTKFRKRWMGRSPQNVAQEIYELYIKYGNLFLIFIDDNFYIDPERSVCILNEIERKCGRTFEFSFCTRVDQIINNGIDYLTFFKKWGCNNIELGVENGSDRILKVFNKKTTANQNIEALRMLRKVKIYPAVDFIMFEPSVTITDLKNNIAFLKEAKLWGYQYPLLYNRIIRLPGTEYWCEIEATDKNYFSDSKVGDIYECINEFRTIYQPEIDLLRNTIIDAKKNSFNKKDYLWLCTLPYELFERLVNTSTDIKYTYFAFLFENKVAARIEEYKLLIN